MLYSSSDALVGIPALCLDVLSALSAVPFVFYVVAGNGLCVRMKDAVWGIVCLTHLLRNNGENLPRP